MKKFDFSAVEEDEDDQLDNALEVGLGNRGIGLKAGGSAMKSRAQPLTTKMSSIIDTGVNMNAYATHAGGEKPYAALEEMAQIKQS